mmetsp:Transcript_18877/g.41354  ORF Transcript_18877/g.41354 Transcript_18877/m.41354 type:complete len:662 (-) Transcript_18877:419-2404(-)
MHSSSRLLRACPSHPYRSTPCTIVQSLRCTAVSPLSENSVAPRLSTRTTRSQSSHSPLEFIHEHRPLGNAKVQSTVRHLHCPCGGTPFPSPKLLCLRVEHKRRRRCGVGRAAHLHLVVLLFPLVLRGVDHHQASTPFAATQYPHHPSIEVLMYHSQLLRCERFAVGAQRIDRTYTPGHMEAPHILLPEALHLPPRVRLQRNGRPLHVHVAVVGLAVPPVALQELRALEHHRQRPSDCVHRPPHASLSAGVPVVLCAEPLLEVPVEMALRVLGALLAASHLVVGAEDADHSVVAVGVVLRDVHHVPDEPQPVVRPLLVQLQRVEVGGVAPARVELGAGDGLGGLRGELRHVELGGELRLKGLVEILDQLPGHVLHAVPPQPVHVVLPEPHAARLQQIRLDLGLVEGELAPPRGVLARLKVDAAVVLGAVPVPHPEVVELGGSVVQHHVHQYRQAQLVTPVHQPAHVICGPPRAVHGQQLPRVVPPQAAELCDRHELHAVEPQRLDVLEAAGGALESAFGGEAADMELVQHQLVPRHQRLVGGQGGGGPREGGGRGGDVAPGGVEIRLPGVRVPPGHLVALLLVAVVPSRLDHQPILAPNRDDALEQPSPIRLFAFLMQRHTVELLRLALLFDLHKHTLTVWYPRPNVHPSLLGGVCCTQRPF